MFSVLIAAATPAVPAAAAKATAAPPQALQDLNLHYQGATPLQAHAPWLTHTFAALFVLSALALIVLLAVQTTKQEGLSGTIGGRVESAYRGRLGFDGQLTRITGVVAVTFVVVATLVSLSGI